LADKYGPRFFMGVGPLVGACGILLLLRTGLKTSFIDDLLPGLIVFGIGLSMTVAPLTATVLADADESDAGIASAVNNAVARIAGLMGISAMSIVVSGTLVGDSFARNSDSVDAFHMVLVICAALVAAGGFVGVFGIVNPSREVEAESCPAGQLVGHETASVDCGDQRALPVGPSGDSSRLIAARRS
jgi:MFS family permease